MVTYKDYEDYFNHLGISETEANVVIKYMYSLAEIGINVLNEKKIECYEELRNMDEGINQASRG
jgi:hypothetical protein